MALIAHAKEIGRSEVYENTSGGAVLYNPELQDVTTILPNGYRCTLALPAIQKGVETEGGRFVPVVEEWSLALPNQRAIIKEVQASLDRDKSYPLFHLVAQLGLEQRMICPEALDGAELTLDRSLRRYWQVDGVVAQARYSCFVPNETVALLQAEKWFG